jgi:hypothetical protein
MLDKYVKISAIIGLAIIAIFLFIYAIYIDEQTHKRYRAMHAILGENDEFEHKYHFIQKIDKYKTNKKTDLLYAFRDGAMLGFVATYASGGETIAVMASSLMWALIRVMMHGIVWLV